MSFVFNLSYWDRLPRKQYGNAYGVLSLDGVDEGNYAERVRIKSLPLSAIKKYLRKKKPFTVQFNPDKRIKISSVSLTEWNQVCLYHDEGVLSLLSEREYFIADGNGKTPYGQFLPQGLFNPYQYNKGFHAVGVHQGISHHFYFWQNTLNLIKFDLDKGRVCESIHYPFSKSKFMDFFDIRPVHEQIMGLLTANVVFRDNQILLCRKGESHHHTLWMQKDRMLMFRGMDAGRFDGIFEIRHNWDTWHCQSYPQEGFGIATTTLDRKKIILVIPLPLDTPESWERALNHYSPLIPVNIPVNVGIPLNDNGFLKQMRLGA